MSEEIVTVSMKIDISEAANIKFALAEMMRKRSKIRELESSIEQLALDVEAIAKDVRSRLIPGRRYVFQNHLDYQYYFVMVDDRGNLQLDTVERLGFL